MAICMTAHYQVEAGKLNEVVKTLKQFVLSIRANEPGILFYMVKQEVIDPTRFIHTMVFEDRRAITLHQMSPATKRFVDVVYPAALEPLEFREFNILGFKAPEGDMGLLGDGGRV